MNGKNGSSRQQDLDLLRVWLGFGISALGILAVVVIFLAADKSTAATVAVMASTMAMIGTLVSRSRR